MTANVCWILSSRFVRPRAPTTVGRRPKAPHSPSLSSCFWPESLTVLRLAGDFLSMPKFDSWARPARCRIGEVRGPQKWLVGVQDVPRVSEIDLGEIYLCGTRGGVYPRVAPAASLRPCARTAASLGLLAALGYPSMCHPATQCLEHSLFNSTHHLFLFLDLLIAPSFALCAQPGVEFCGVGVGIGGAG